MSDERINRARAVIKKLKELSLKYRVRVENIEIAKSGYDLKERIDPTNYSFSPFPLFSTWGGEDQHYIFKADISSLNLEKEKEYFIELETGAYNIWNTNNPQILCYLNRNLRYTFDMNHFSWPIKIKDDGTEIIFYAYSNVKESSNFFNLSIAERDQEVEALYYDLSIIYDATSLLSALDTRKDDALRALDDAITLLSLRAPYSDEFNSSVKNAREYIKKEYYERLPISPVTIHAVGSTHIDIAWKWPVRQTREKAVRSLLTAINLMKDYPEYKFTLSGPILYEFVKELAPSIYENVLSLIKEGRWEAEGAMYLESETNLSSLSSLMHQFEYGLKFFKDELKAKRPEILWLPDCFGFSEVIPSLMNLYGIPYFATTKIGWNDTNRFPYDTFKWRGQGGKEVLSHFVTTTEYKENGVPSVNTTYNALNTASQNLGTWQRYQDKDKGRTLMTIYGYGDGGGGPTREMIERAKRMEKSVAGLCSMRFSHALPFFKALEKEMENKEVNIWSGELYLEYHRATYTSQAETKKLNRKTEYLTEDAEFFSVLAGKDNSKELKKSWMALILNDFHDILPGSSIHEVYEEAKEDYEKAIKRNEGIIRGAISSLVTDDNAITLFNTSPVEVESIIELNENTELLKTERTFDGKLMALSPSIPPYGYLSINEKEERKEEDNVLKEISAHSFETKYYTFTLNVDGELTSLFDKEEEREAVKENGVLNRILFYEDIPTDYDAWNTEHYRRKKSYKGESVKISLIENNTIRAVIKVERTFHNSSLSSNIIFYNHTKRIDFATAIDYREHQTFIKAEFDLDIETEDVYCDMQAGETIRSTLNNTSWEKAQFEIPAHKYIRVSEGNYGFALLSDSRYGYSAKYGTLTISLLKGGIFPDPEQDVGCHETLYSLLPYSDKREVLKEAYSINKNLYVSKGSYKRGSFVEASDGIIIDSVRKAEDNSVLLTCYEFDGERKRAILKTENPQDIYIAHFDGKPDELIKEKATEVELQFRPREIKVLKLI